MGINAEQFRFLIVRPVLKEIGLWCPSSETLIMGTAAQESHIGTYLKQISGPALGIFQMEPATYHDIIKNVVERVRKKSPYLRTYSFDRKPEEMMYDLKLATIMCRLQYWRFEEALPKYNDTQGMAEYWKKYYNTIKGKGECKDFVHNYRLTEIETCY